MIYCLSYIWVPECDVTPLDRRLSNAVRFIVLRELDYLIKGPDIEAIFSAVCSSDIIKQHNIITHLQHLFWLVWFAQTADTEFRMTSSAYAVTFALIGLYRDVWIAAIASSRKSLATQTAAICVRFQGRRVRHVYVTMQITFLARKSALIYRRGLRQRVASLTIDCNGVFAIRAYADSCWTFLFLTIAIRLAKPTTGINIIHGLMSL